MPPSTSRSVVAVSAVLAAGLLLGGCDLLGDRTGDPQAAASVVPAVRPVELDLPAATRPEGPVLSDPGIVGAVGDLPWYVAARWTEPGGPAGVGVWTAGPDGLPAEPRVLDVPGEVRSVLTAGGRRAAAVVGTTWADGRHGTFLALSTDRVRWTSLEVPLLDRLDVRAVTAAGGGVLAVGVDRDDDGVRAVRIAPDGAATPLDLAAEVDADGGDGDVRVVGAAGDGQELVVLVSERSAAGDEDVVAVRSRDGGGTWTRYVLPGEHPAVAGVAAIKGGFVVTGTTREVLPSGVGTNGTHWTVDHESGRWTHHRSEVVVAGEVSNGFGAPTRVGGGYAAVQWFDSYRLAAVVFGAGGRETARVATERVGHLTPGGPSAGSGDGRVLSVLSGQHGAVVVATAADDPASAEIVAELAAPRWWHEPTGGGHAVPGTVPVVRTSFEIVGEGWRTTPLYADLELADGRLRAVGAEGERRFVAEAPDGRVAGLSTRWLDDDQGGGHGVVPQYRTAAGWQSGSPIEVDGYAVASDVVRADGRWLAVGEVRAELDPASSRRAVLWTSEDGKAWKAVRGFRPGAGSSTADRLCTTGGRTFVIGEADGADVVWTARDGRWRRSPLDLPSGESIHECRPDGAGAALVRFDVDDRTELRRTTNGRTFETVHTTGADEQLGEVVDVGDGFAAEGHVETPGWDGPVLWFSRDGADWWWLPARGMHPDLVSVRALDAGLVVAAATPGGSRAWLVEDVESLLAAGPAGAGGGQG